MVLLQKAGDHLLQSDQIQRHSDRLYLAGSGIIVDFSKLFCSHTAGGLVFRIQALPIVTFNSLHGIKKYIILILLRSSVNSVSHTFIKAYGLAWVGNRCIPIN